MLYKFYVIRVYTHAVEYPHPHIVHSISWVWWSTCTPPYTCTKVWWSEEENDQI